MASRECGRCNFGEIEDADGRTHPCPKCRGSGFVRVEDGTPLPIKLAEAVGGLRRAERKGPDYFRAEGWRRIPGVVLKDRHGDTFIVADHPHQKGLKGTEVAAWLQDGTERPSPMVVFAEDLEYPV